MGEGGCWRQSAKIGFTGVWQVEKKGVELLDDKIVYFSASLFY